MSKNKITADSFNEFFNARNLDLRAEVGDSIDEMLFKIVKVLAERVDELSESVDRLERKAR